MIVAVLCGVLAACTTSDTDDQEPTAMYCELIDEATVQPLVADHKITSHGAPSPKRDSRRIQCSLEAQGMHEPVLTVHQYELWDETLAETDRTKTTDRLAQLQSENAAHLTELGDGSEAVGFAWFTGDSAEAVLITGERTIEVVAPADEAQAEEFTKVVAQVASEFDTNLDAWDEANPAD